MALEWVFGGEVQRGGVLLEAKRLVSRRCLLWLLLWKIHAISHFEIVLVIRVFWSLPIVIWKKCLVLQIVLLLLIFTTSKPCGCVRRKMCLQRLLFLDEITLPSRNMVPIFVRTLLLLLHSLQEEQFLVNYILTSIRPIQIFVVLVTRRNNTVSLNWIHVLESFVVVLDVEVFDVAEVAHVLHIGWVFLIVDQLWLP